MSLRWAFRYGSWRPTEEEWMRACASVQMEERYRVGQFCYKRDAKASLCGRLMLRKAASSLLGIPYTEVAFGRSAAGKPVLTNAEISPGFSVNISHQGSYTVLAAELHREVGVDVMNIARPANTSVQNFFRLMQSNFTPSEWVYIRCGSVSSSTERDDASTNCLDEDQLTRFYRMWCLKESFIKADGKGLQISLQRMSFTPCELQLSPLADVMSVGTTLHFDGMLSESWQFHEGYVDDLHLASVCVGPLCAPASSERSQYPPLSNRFTHLTVPQLLDGVEEIQPRDINWWREFAPREEEPMRRPPAT